MVARDWGRNRWVGVVDFNGLGNRGVGVLWNVWVSWLEVVGLGVMEGGRLVVVLGNEEWVRG